MDLKKWKMGLKLYLKNAKRLRDECVEAAVGVVDSDYFYHHDNLPNKYEDYYNLLDPEDIRKIEEDFFFMRELNYLWIIASLFE